MDLNEKKARAYDLNLQLQQLQVQLKEEFEMQYQRQFKRLSAPLLQELGPLNQEIADAELQKKEQAEQNRTP